MLGNLVLIALHVQCNLVKYILMQICFGSFFYHMQHSTYLLDHWSRAYISFLLNQTIRYGLFLRMILGNLLSAFDLVSSDFVHIFPFFSFLLCFVLLIFFWVICFSKDINLNRAWFIHLAIKTGKETNS